MFCFCGCDSPSAMPRSRMRFRRRIYNSTQSAPSLRKARSFHSDPCGRLSSKAVGYVGLGSRRTPTIGLTAIMSGLSEYLEGVGERRVSQSWSQLNDYSGAMERSSFAEQRDDDLIPRASRGFSVGRLSESRASLCHSAIGRIGSGRLTSNFLGPDERAQAAITCIARHLAAPCRRTAHHEPPPSIAEGPWDQ